MSTIYLKSNPVMAVNKSHIWRRWEINSEPGKWYVCGIVSFTKSGFACVDDFGNLVEVAR